MIVKLIIDEIEYQCTPKILNKERVKNNIENKFVEFEQNMNSYGIIQLVPIFYKHVLSSYQSLMLSYTATRLNLTIIDTRKVLVIAMRAGLLCNGNNCRYIIPFDIKESVLQLMRERSEA